MLSFMHNTHTIPLRGARGALLPVLLCLLLLSLNLTLSQAEPYTCSWAEASTTSALAWSAVTSNAAGNVISAAVNGAKIWTSTDGITYTESSALAKDWSALASSASGTDQVASTDSTTTGEIYYR
jgi:hypothetical protein